MNIINHKEEAPLAHYRARFEALDPMEAAARCGVAYDAREGFSVRFLGRDYVVHWPDFEIASKAGGTPLPGGVPAGLLILRYLLEGCASRGTGKFLTYREMPWGEVYVKPFTGRCLERAARLFGSRLRDFEAAARKMGARPVEAGDAAFEFTLLPGYALRMILWAADDEFPPGCQMLFSDNFPLSFSAEDRTVAGDVLISSIRCVMDGKPAH